jgi:hypothetical protein
LDENGKLSGEFICKKLKCKVNWIAELYAFKKGLSREWANILFEENYISSIVNTTKDKVICSNTYMDINIFTNKLFYNSMLNAKATNPIGSNNWSIHFNLEEKPDLSQIYSFISTKKSLTVWRLKL